MNFSSAKRILVLGLTGTICCLSACGETTTDAKHTRQKGEDCDKINQCMEGLYCEDGKCRTLCQKKEDCGAKEHCDNGKCVANLDDSCPTGFTGDLCDQCLAKHWGPDCTDCNCQHGTCSEGITGDGTCECNKGWTGDDCSQCQDGFTGEKCDKCQDNHFGPNCEECTCGIHGSCDKGITGTGKCTCEPHWTGDSCTEENPCDEGKTGDNCENCQHDYYGEFCEICTCKHGECFDGKYGNGQCKADSCEPGWIGVNCDKCDDDYVGDNCQLNTCINGIVDESTDSIGHCLSCNNHWVGDDCNVCPDNFTGEDCNSCAEGYIGDNCVKCPICKNGGICVAGKDDTAQCECVNAWTGATCNTCEGYGTNCTAYGSVTDQDGHPYKTARIGNQIWMAENYHRENGTFRSPGGSIDNIKTYGLLYNWETVTKTEFCPKGWRVPTLDDFESLINTTNSDKDPKGLMSKNWSGTNATGFNALPAGYAFDNGNLANFKKYAYFWSKTAYENSSGFAYGMSIGDTAHTGNNNFQSTFMSVRCLKDAD